MRPGLRHQQQPCWLDCRYVSITDTRRKWLGRNGSRTPASWVCKCEPECSSSSYEWGRFQCVRRGCGLCLVRASLAHQQISVSNLMQMEGWDQHFASCQASLDRRHTQTHTRGSKHLNFHRTQKLIFVCYTEKAIVILTKTKCQTGFWAFSRCVARPPPSWW